MKNLILTILLIGFSGILAAQSKFGAISYQMPDNWEAMPVGDNQLIFIPSDPDCRCAFFPTLPYPIQSEQEFISLREQKINDLGFLRNYHNPTEISTMEGWNYFGSFAEINSLLDKFGMIHVFSASNLSTGFMYETSNTVCKDQIFQIMSTIGIDTPTTQSPETQNSKNTKPKPIKDLRGIADPNKGKGKGKN
ncbi:hypothetical protein [Shivajiella indica]|uniref:Uncharacterized protein n=1 Tax=Shivajiella indica TaxID=872115 RepID=A0ABW5B9R7_9BACT